jgi:lipoate-protein ligase A
MEKWSTAEAGLTLRLDGAASGEHNMRLDAAMLHRIETVAAASPLLRFYSWSPAAISLGHHQDESDLDLDRARGDGYDVVRRPTGGGAVLHDNELTYAFAARWPSLSKGRRVREVYGVIADSFVAALSGCGVPAERGGAGGAHQALCFAQSQSHEIQVGGRKLIGSAMRAGRRGFLIHGSILCGPEHRRLGAYARQGGGALAVQTTDLIELGFDTDARIGLCRSIAEALAAAWRRETLAAA